MSAGVAEVVSTRASRSGETSCVDRHFHVINKYARFKTHSGDSLILSAFVAFAVGAQNNETQAQSTNGTAHTQSAGQTKKPAGPAAAKPVPPPNPKADALEQALQHKMSEMASTSSVPASTKVILAPAPEPKPAAVTPPPSPPPTAAPPPRSSRLPLSLPPTQPVRPDNRYRIVACRYLDSG